MQLTFDFPPQEDWGRESFIRAPANQMAASVIDNWPDWPARFFSISGPAQCGKSHLGEIWKQQSGATRINPASLSLTAAGRPVFLLDMGAEDTISRKNQETLFYLYNRVLDEDGWLLLLARSAPAHWPAIEIVDLRSRLRAIPAVEIERPDDCLLKNIFRKKLSEKQIDCGDNVAEYVLKRTERSFDTIARIVDLADHKSLTEGRPITIPLVRSILDEQNL